MIKGSGAQYRNRDFLGAGACSISGMVYEVCITHNIFAIRLFGGARETDPLIIEPCIICFSSKRRYEDLHARRDWRMLCADPLRRCAILDAIVTYTLFTYLSYLEQVVFKSWAIRRA